MDIIILILGTALVNNRVTLQKMKISGGNSMIIEQVWFLKNKFLMKLSEDKVTNQLLLYFILAKKFRIFLKNLVLFSLQLEQMLLK